MRHSTTNCVMYPSQWQKAAGKDSAACQDSDATTNLYTPCCDNRAIHQGILPHHAIKNNRVGFKSKVAFSTAKLAVHFQGL